jgi:hypothetical protein
VHVVAEHRDHGAAAVAHVARPPASPAPLCSGQAGPPGSSLRRARHTLHGWLLQAPPGSPAGLKMGGSCVVCAGAGPDRMQGQGPALLPPTCPAPTGCPR